MIEVEKIPIDYIGHFPITFLLEGIVETFLLGKSRQYNLLIVKNLVSD